MTIFVVVCWFVVGLLVVCLFVGCSNLLFVRWLFVGTFSCSCMSLLVGCCNFVLVHLFLVHCVCYVILFLFCLCCLFAYVFVRVVVSLFVCLFVFCGLLL